MLLLLFAVGVAFDLNCELANMILFGIRHVPSLVDMLHGWVGGTG